MIQRALCAALALASMNAGAYNLTLDPAIPIGSDPDSVAIADVDGDGRNDVILSTGFYFDATNDYHDFVFLQRADGTLAPPVSFPNGGTYADTPMIAADLDGDGKAELIHGNNLGITISTRVGATFVTRQISDTKTPVVLAALDVDHDGYKDIVAQSWSSGATIFYGDADGTFARKRSLPTPLQGYDDMKAVDVNGDGYTDLVMSSVQQSAPSLFVLYNDRNGYFGTPVALAVPDRVQGIAAADFTGDGRIDIVGSRPRNSPTSVYLLTQGAADTFGPATSFASYDIPQQMVAGDFDTDGRMDFAVIHSGWASLGIYFQGAQGPQAEVRFAAYGSPSYSPHAIAAGDINGDGCTDFVVADYNRGLEIHRGSGCVSTDLAATIPKAIYKQVVARVRNASAVTSYGSTALVTFLGSDEDYGYAVTSAPASCVVLDLPPPETPPAGGDDATGQVGLTVGPYLAYGCDLGTLAAGATQDLTFGLNSKYPSQIDATAYSRTRDATPGNDHQSAITNPR